MNIHRDFKRNDDVYVELENQNLNNEYRVDPTRERKARTDEEMSQEAAMLRKLFI